MTDYAFILGKKFPDSQWSLDGDDYEGLQWMDNSIPKPSREELDNAYADYMRKHGYVSKRERAYEDRGCTTHALICALWERVVEGRPEESDAIQIIRESVKEDFPKPEPEDS